MDRNQRKIVGIACLVVCLVCLFVAYERYSTNAKNVRAMNEFRNTMPFGNMGPFGSMMPPGGMMGGELRPAMPAATKYALLFALLSGVGGAALLTTKGARDGSSPSAHE